MDTKMEQTIKKLQTEGEKYRITNERLFAVCKEIEKTILKATPDNFTCEIQGNFGELEIGRYAGYDAGIWRNFRYIRYLDEPLTVIWFNDARVGTICGSRTNRITFLKNLDKILDALVQKLQLQNANAEEVLNRIKIEPEGQQ
ncbi:MAG: hypothetical protein ABC596_08840 [Candidatus Methanosuratincola petrocarbonis]